MTPRISRSVKLRTEQVILPSSFVMAAIPITAFLILFVLEFAAIAGALTAIPLLYIRRRLNGELANGKIHAM